MNSGSVARRYARALFELASKRSDVDRVQQHLEVFAEAISHVDADAVAPGALPLEARARMAERVAEGFGGDGLFARFLRVLAANDRLSEAPRIASWFSSMKDAAEGRVRATVASAVALGDAERQAIEAAFERVVGKRVIAEATVDASLLGGVVVELEGRVYDGSVRSAFERLGRRMAGSFARAAG